MKRYRILKLVILGFIVDGEQADAKLKVGEDLIESDGHTIWALMDGQRVESTTMANAVGLWLTEGRIEEVPADEAVAGT